MKKFPVVGAVALALLVIAAASPTVAEADTPKILSMSALAFGPDGTLFVGDSKGGAVFALPVSDEKSTTWSERTTVANIEAKIAAALGTTADEVLIHDMAVHPKTQGVYLAVSRGRGEWATRWLLPNDVADASILLRIDGKGGIGEVKLEGLEIVKAALPNPVASEKKHRWKDGVSLRADTITDLVYSEGTLYVAGLSNEEFASTLWKIPYPFEEGITATTLEIFHGAHGEFETHAPIRTFVPYSLEGERHVLAAYLCTPFVTFKESELVGGEHVKGRTIAEFGSGNYPLDMIVYQKEGKDRLLIANSNLPLMIVKPEDIEAFEGEILEEPETYAAGLNFEHRSGSGIQQLDLLNSDQVVMLQRLPGGTMDLLTTTVRRF